MAIRLTLRHPSGEDLTELTFDQQRVRIGRGKGCDLRIPHPAVSLEHAMVLLEGSRYYLIDMGSTNGTTLAGEVLVMQRRKLLRPGDVVGIADFEIEFRAGVPMASHHSQDRTAAVARSLAQQLLVEGQQELVGPALIVANGPQDGERFELDDPPATLIVGRATECDITLVDSEVSRHHLELKITAEGVLAHDLGGKNPLLVNDRETAQHRLHDRDELLLGSTTLIFDDPVEAYLLELAKRPEGATDRMLPVSLKGDTPSPKSTRREKIGGLQATRPRERDRRSAHGERRIAKDTIAPNSTGGSDELSPAQAESGADHKVISPEAASHPAADSAPGPGLRDLQHRSFPGGSAGSEVAILLVGALVLAACVAALVWIFR